MEVVKPVWPDLTTFYHFGSICNNFWPFLVCEKRLNTHLSNFYAIGHIYTAVNGQILSK